MADSPQALQLSLWGYYQRMFVVLFVIAVVAALVIVGVRVAMAGRRQSRHDAQPVAVDATFEGTHRAPKPHGPGDPLEREH